jgi:VanZ family protein
LWLRAFDRKKYGSHFPIANTLILIGLVLFAVSDEFHQSFVPGRTASLMDVGLDLIGIFLGFSVSQLSLETGTK